VRIAQQFDTGSRIGEQQAMAGQLLAAAPTRAFRGDVTGQRSNAEPFVREGQLKIRAAHDFPPSKVTIDKRTHTQSKCRETCATFYTSAAVVTLVVSQI
jgi:hypothetical protein